jgi:hypothetical protein
MAIESEYRVECTPTHHDGIDTLEECRVAVLLTAVRREPIERAVTPSDETVDARPNEGGALDGPRHGFRREARMCSRYLIIKHERIRKVLTTCS